MATLFIMLGLPGSGKSTFAEQISTELPALWLNSDGVRAAMFEEPTEITDPALRYDAVFGAMDYAAKYALTASCDVVYDANNHRVTDREMLRIIATRIGAKAITIFMDTPLEVSRQRALARAASGKQSDMTLEKLEKHRKLLELPIEGEPLIVVDGQQDFPNQLKSFKKQLSNL